MPRFQHRHASHPDSNKNLNARRVTEKSLRAGREAVSTGLVDDDKIAWLGNGEFHAIGEKVERRAQRADDRDVFAHLVARSAAHAIADCRRVVLADHLPEITRCRKVVMQAAVGDEENLTARDFAIDDTRYIDASFSDEVTAEFDDEFGMW